MSTEEEETVFKGLTLAELKSMCEHYKLSTAGRKQQLVDRLEDHCAKIREKQEEQQRVNSQKTRNLRRNLEDLLHNVTSRATRLRGIPPSASAQEQSVVGLGNNSNTQQQQQHGMTVGGDNSREDKCASKAHEAKGRRAATKRRLVSLCAQCGLRLPEWPFCGVTGETHILPDKEAMTASDRHAAAAADSSSEEQHVRKRNVEKTDDVQANATSLTNPQGTTTALRGNNHRQPSREAVDAAVEMPMCELGHSMEPRCSEEVQAGSSSRRRQRSSRRGGSPTRVHVGQLVEAKWGGHWYPAHVERTEADGSVIVIRWEGKSSGNEVLDGRDVRIPLTDVFGDSSERHGMLLSALRASQRSTQC